MRNHLETHLLSAEHREEKNHSGLEGKRKLEEENKTRKQKNIMSLEIKV